MDLGIRIGGKEVTDEGDDGLVGGSPLLEEDPEGVGPKPLQAAVAVDKLGKEDAGAGELDFVPHRIGCGAGRALNKEQVGLNSSLSETIDVDRGGCRRT